MVGEDKLVFEGVSAQHLARKVFAKLFSKSDNLAPEGASAFLLYNRLRFHFSFAPFLEKHRTSPFSKIRLRSAL